MLRQRQAMADLCEGLRDLRSHADDVGLRPELEQIVTEATQGDDIVAAFGGLLARMGVPHDEDTRSVRIPGLGSGRAIPGEFACPMRCCDRRWARHGTGQTIPVCSLHGLPLRAVGDR